MGSMRSPICNQSRPLDFASGGERREGGDAVRRRSRARPRGRRVVACRAAYLEQSLKTGSRGVATLTPRQATSGAQRSGSRDVAAQSRQRISSNA